MIRFVVRRTASMLVVLFAISVLTFLIFQAIPNGDPAQRLAGRTSTPETVAAIRRAWGFDKPIYDQYLLTMKHVFTGNVVSYTQQVNVEREIVQDLPPTLSLALGAGLIWLCLGVALGLLTAAHAGGLLDRGLTVLALVGVSMPVFLLGAVLLYALAYKIQLFPNGGYVGLTTDPVQWLWHMILPWAALSALFIGFYSRVLRANVLDTLGEDFVRTARAKGLAILTESVFNLHGVGQYAAQSIGELDVPPVLVIVMFGSFFVVLLSALTDIAFALIDPRIRLS
jgi:peptide/nickel transport system permease protein